MRNWRSVRNSRVAGIGSIVTALSVLVKGLAIAVVLLSVSVFSFEARADDEENFGAGAAAADTSGTDEDGELGGAAQS